MISCVADTELLLVKVPVAAVEPTKNWATSTAVAFKVRAHGNVLLETDVAGGEGGQQRAILGADRGGGVPELQVCRRALQQGRVHEAGCGEGVHRQISGRVYARAVLQVRDPLAQAVEICDEGIAGVRLALGPTVAADLEGAAVAQDGLSREGRLAEQVPDYPGRELGLDQIEDPAALCARAVDEVPGIEWAQVIRPQKAAVRLGLGPGITAESQGTLIAQNGVPDRGASRSSLRMVLGVNCS